MGVHLDFSAFCIASSTVFGQANFKKFGVKEKISMITKSNGLHGFRSIQSPKSPSTASRVDLDW